MNAFRIKFSSFDNLLNFSNHVFCSSSHIGIEITSCFVKLKITNFISPFRFDQGKISKDRVFLEILLTFEYFYWFGLRKDLRLQTFFGFFVFYYVSTSFHDCVNSCFSVKGRYPSSTTSYFLSESTLRTNLQLQFPIEVLPLTFNILAQMRKYHSFYLLSPKQHAQAPIAFKILTINSATIRDDSEILGFR